MDKLKSELKTLKFWSIFTAYIETTLLIHNNTSFQTLEFALRENHFYNDTTPERQSEIYSNLYLTITVTSLVLSLIAGFITDAKGTWWSRCLAQILMFIGIIAGFFISAERHYLIWIAYPLFYAGGSVNSESNMLCYILYPTKIGMLSSLTGLSVAASQAWYLFYKDICIPFENLKLFWGIMLALMPFMVFRTFILLPKLKVTSHGKQQSLGWKTRKDEYEEFNNLTITSDYEITPMKKQDSVPNSTSTNSKPKSTLFKELTRPHIVMLFTWCCISDFRVYLYYSKFQYWLRTKTMDAKYISKYTKVFSYCLMSQMIADPLCGFFIDLANRFYRKRLKFDHVKATVLTCAGSLIVCTFLLTTVSFLQVQDFQPSGWNIISAGISVAFIDSIRFSAKFMFLFTVIDGEFIPRVMGIGSFFIILVNISLIVATKLVNQYSDGDWNGLFNVLGYVTAGSVVLPLGIIYIYFFKK